MRKSMDRTGRGVMGGSGTDGGHRMACIDVDSDRRICNSSRTQLRIAAPGARYRTVLADTTPTRPLEFAGIRSTLRIDSDVFGMKPVLRSGADRHTFRCTTRDRGYLLCALFVQAHSRR